MTNKIRAWLNDESRSLQFYGIFRFIAIVLMGVLLVKFGYDTAQVSIFEKYLFYTSSLSFFISNAINKTLISNDSKKSDLPVIPLVLIVTIISVIIGYFLMGFTSDISKTLVLILLITLPFSNSLEYFLLVKKKILGIYRWGTVIHLGWLAAFTFFVWNDWSIENIIKAYIFLHLIKSLLSLFYLNYNAQNYQFNYTRKIFIDFLFIGLISGLMDYVDGYLVQWIYPQFDFSIFRYGARELPLLSIILTSIASGFALKIQRSEEQWQSEMRQRLKTMITWTFPLIILFLFISPWVFKLVFSEEYSSSAQFFNIYLLLLLSRIFIGQSVLIAKMKNRFLLQLSILELLLNVLLSVLFSSIFGIIGILYGTVGAYLIQKIVLAIYIENTLQLKIKDFFPFRTYAIFSILVIISFVLAQNQIP